mgnify:CR=1 FL=1
MGMLKGLVERVGGASVFYRSPRAPDEVPLPGFPNLIRRKDLAPNEKGAGIFGFQRTGDENAEGGLDALADHVLTSTTTGRPG